MKTNTHHHRISYFLPSLFMEQFRSIIRFFHGFISFLLRVFRYMSQKSTIAKIFILWHNIMKTPISMNQMSWPHWLATLAQRSKRIVAGLAVAGILLGSFPVQAIASSWSPTLLVNTESFQSIDDGSGSSDVELRFGVTLNEKIYWDRTNAEFRFSDDIRVDGNITASGTLTVSGDAKTKADLTINSDQGDGNAVLTFGSDTTDETLTFINLADRFEFSDDLRVSGGLYASGSLIVEDGQTFTIEGITYTFPQSDGVGSGRFLTTNGAGTLSWSDGVGSGEILTLEPEYTGSVYFASGT